jgi:hypothetical protein
VIEGAVQHLLHGVAALRAPGQQMADVLGRRGEHFGAQEAAGAGLGIDVQRALVLQHHAAAALVVEGHLPGLERDTLPQQLRMAGAGHHRSADR